MFPYDHLVGKPRRSSFDMLVNYTRNYLDLPDGVSVCLLHKDDHGYELTIDNKEMFWFVLDSSKGSVFDIIGREKTPRTPSYKEKSANFTTDVRPPRDGIIKLYAGDKCK